MVSVPFTWFNLNDGATGELSADVTAAVTTWVLKAGQGIKFPASDFVVKCGEERIHVATRTTDTLSGLTRGYDGSTAAVHAGNARVYQSTDRSLFQRIYDNITGHTHQKEDITDFAHNHAQGDVTNLVSDLAGKEAAGTAASQVAAHAAAADPHTGYQKESEKGVANGYASLDAGGLVPSSQLPASGGSTVLFKNLSASATGGNVNTAQPWFPTAGAVTVTADRTYRFRGLLHMSRSAGTTSHTTGLSFGGTATLTSIRYLARVKVGDVATNAALNATLIAVATNTAVKAASVSASENIIVEVEGTVRVNAGGTFIPRFQFSAVPGGAPTIQPNTFFELTDIGSGSVVTAGTWA